MCYHDDKNYHFANFFPDVTLRDFIEYLWVKHSFPRAEVAEILKIGAQGEDQY